MIFANGEVARHLEVGIPGIPFDWRPRSRRTLSFVDEAARDSDIVTGCVIS